MADQKDFDEDVSQVKKYVDPFDPEKDITTFALRNQVIVWLDSQRGGLD